MQVLFFHVQAWKINDQKRRTALKIRSVFMKISLDTFVEFQIYN